MQAGLTVECLDTRPQLDRLVRDWERLLSASDVASPFLTPGWQAAWLDTYGRARALRILTARRGEVLVGLWPLSVRRRGLFRVLEPIGAGRSDWLDVLTVAEERGAVLEAFLEHLAEHRSEWDLLECRDVLSESPTLLALERFSDDAPLKLRRELRTVAPYLTLGTSWQQYMAGKSSKSRSTLKYKRRAAERDCAGFRISRHEWLAADDVVDRLAEVESHSWKAREGNLKLATPAGREFYRRFCDYFAARGQLDLWRADCEAGLIAYLVNIRFGNKCYHYNASFDGRYGQHSPGLLLHADAIQDAFGRQLSEYDFLSGDEPYKDRWCSSKRTIHHLAAYHAGLRSRAAFAALVGLRWMFRRSRMLRTARQHLLTAARRLQRGGGET